MVTMMQTLKNIFNWIYTSSADPSKVSLTVKSVLLGIVPIIISVAGLTHLNIDSGTLTSMFDAVATLVQDVLTVVSTIGVVYGGVRKIYLSIFPAQN